MKNKILIILIPILSLILFIVVSFKKENDHSFFTPEETIKIKNEDNTIEELKLEEYLVGVLAAEMPASFPEEALKAQAVASRTYALYQIIHSTKDYDILTDVTNQSFITKEQMQTLWGEDYDYYYNKINNAVLDTYHEVIYYNDEIIEAFYFSMSNGTTENASSVFQENLPYIKSVSSSWDNETLNNFEVTKNFSKTDFCLLLDLNDCANITINKIDRNATNRVENITINNITLKGTTFRSLLSLRSTDFTITINEDTVSITTKGYGHGLGLSQYGASGMAKDGYNYQEILKYYYNDITIKKMV